MERSSSYDRRAANPCEDRSYSDLKSRETAKGGQTGLKILREEKVRRTRPHRAPFVILRCAQCHRIRYAKVGQKQVYCYGCEKTFSLVTKKSPLKVVGFANTARQASDVIRNMKEGHYVEKRLGRSIEGPT